LDNKFFKNGKPEFNNPFRTNYNNTYLTKGLFYEVSFPSKETVMYTLKNHDHMGYPSLYRLYMEEADPTEWSVSQKYFDGWDHWELVCNSSFFKPYIEKWRRDLDLQIKSQALAKIRAEAKTTSKDSVMANKYLLEKGWEAKSSRGRPSKAEIKKAADDIANNHSQLVEDFNRLNLELKGN
jgi:hypothetical protein